jgi:two-component system, OmpR family, response regulator
MPLRELEKILYVEDDADIQEIAGIALKMLGGFELAACFSGSEALAKAANWNADLVILDVMMPGMDGPETLLELRKLPNYQHVPVIFMTAKSQGSEVKRFLSLGAIEVITKPFDPVHLATQIKTIWNKYHG